MIKKIVLSFVILFLWFFSFISLAAPSFNSVRDENLWYNKGFTKNGALWIKQDIISRNRSLKDNIMDLFFPSASDGWKIWTKIRDISVWIVFLFLLWAWSLFVLNSGDDTKLKEAKSNILYIFYWIFLIFGSVWLLGSVLNVWWNNVTATNTVVNTQNKVLWSILIFFKSAAYYIAFIMMVYYGYKMMQAQEKEDKIKTARTWIINIILALIAIKVLDYVYYIAQSDSFVWQASNLMTWIAKVLGWILWVIIILVLIYAWFLLISSRWNEEAMKKSKKIIQNVFLWVFVLFLFIVIVYDLVRNFSA